MESRSLTQRNKHTHQDWPPIILPRTCSSCLSYSSCLVYCKWLLKCASMPLSSCIWTPDSSHPYLNVASNFLTTLAFYLLRITFLPWSLRPNDDISPEHAYKLYVRCTHGKMDNDWTSMQGNCIIIYGSVHLHQPEQESTVQHVYISMELMIHK